MMDNKSAELGAWNGDLLPLEFRELLDLDLSGALDLNIELSGFSTAETDKLLEVSLGEDGDSVPDVEQVAITRIGDLHVTHSQQLLCSNSPEEECYDRSEKQPYEHQ